MLMLLPSILCATFAVQTQTPQPPEYGERQGEIQSSEKRHYVSLEKVLDAELRLRSGMRDETMQGDVQGETTRGDTGDVRGDFDDDSASKAKVEDLVLNREGEVRFVAVSHEGRIVLVPASRLSHDRTKSMEKRKQVCSLQISPQELQNLPEFDRDAVRENNTLDSTVRTVSASFPGEWQAHGEKVHDKDLDQGIGERGEYGAKEKEASMSVGQKHVLASDLLEIEVEASAEEFGEVSDAAIDIDTQRVDFLIVSHGGTFGLGGDEYVIPVGAVEMADKEGERNKCVARVSKTVEQIEENGVKFEKPADGEAIISPNVARRAEEFHGVSGMGSRSKSMESQRTSGR